MALPEFSMRQLLEAGAHFGHQTHRWNPKMKSFIFGDRANIHIIDLSQTVPLLHQALVRVRDVAAKGGRILFVGTKRQASEIIAQNASRCAQYYMNNRWLGGTLTNWATISKSIARLRELEDLLNDEQASAGFTKKELLNLTREREKLELSLGGIKEMGGTPDLMFVIDTNKEAIAIQEARKLGIPVIGIVDTNCDPDPIDFPIPGNDDAARAISLYCELIADAVLDGITQGQADLGVDLGAAVEPAVEAALTEEPAAEAAPAPEAPAEDAAPAPAATEKAAEKPAEEKTEG
ncbi:30S ribosomal protein S2 [Hyphobacterium sp.]|uniref:30S ribosomal protein S2 n=1 Tax=Hyphobacterium sp. TaxID=2004662 RepID=UPI003B52CE78